MQYLVVQAWQGARLISRILPQPVNTVEVPIDVQACRTYRTLLSGEHLLCCLQLYLEIVQELTDPCRHELTYVGVGAPPRTVARWHYHCERSCWRDVTILACVRWAANNCWDIAAIVSMPLLEMDHYWNWVRHNMVIMLSLAGASDKEKHKKGRNGDDKGSSCLMERSLQLRWRSKVFHKTPLALSSCALFINSMRTVWLSIFNCSDDRSRIGNVKE